MGGRMLSLYRRHRPRTFDDVVGQEHIVRTLRNAVELGKVHHAYLFVGSRGTGKTSMAKLLACSLNAEGGPRTDFSPEDPVCRAIADGTSLDVVEMDAASNNSVDDIRELRENVALAPIGGGRRIYILDEAHMLTTPAWNAFLKTLEEPPPHVVFVLATTEAHKVPPTIVDRCHRFDFQRPTLDQVATVLRRVADVEGIDVPDPAVAMIARAATGSFRDALGTLEQLVTYGGREVRLDDVLEVLGVADAELVLQTADAICDHDPKAALRAVARVSDSGRDLTQFMRDLAAHLRHLYVVQTIGDVPDSFSVTAEHPGRLAGQADRLAQGEVLRGIDLLGEALSAVKDGSEPRIRLELALLKAVQPQADLSLQALMFRIEQLEERLAAVASGPTPMDASAREGQPEEPSAAGSAGSVAGAGVTPPPDGEPVRDARAAGRAAPSGGAAAATAAAAAPVAADAPQPVASDRPQLDPERLRTRWPAVVDVVRGENAMVGALLAEARPAEIQSGQLTIDFPADAEFSRRKAEASVRLIEPALRALTGHPLRLAFRLGGDPPDPPRLLSEEELLERLKQEFDAREIVDDSDDPGAAAQAGPDEPGAARAGPSAAAEAEPAVDPPPTDDPAD
jgi:DNA polymerase-3 subunit gamma/tau